MSVCVCVCVSLCVCMRVCVCYHIDLVRCSQIQMWITLRLSLDQRYIIFLRDCLQAKIVYGTLCVIIISVTINYGKKAIYIKYITDHTRYI